MCLGLPVPYYNQKFFGWEHNSYAEKGALMAGNVLSSDEGTIPARYATKSKRKFSWRMASCYCLSWKHSHSALAHCTLVKIFYVFSLCVVVEQSVAPTNTGSGVPRTAPDTPQTLAGIILWCVNCRQRSSSFVYGTCRRYMTIQSSRILNHGGSWQCVWPTAHSVQFAHTGCYALNPLGKNESY